MVSSIDEKHASISQIYIGVHPTLGVLCDIGLYLIRKAINAKSQKKKKKKNTDYASMETKGLSSRAQ